MMEGMKGVIMNHEIKLERNPVNQHYEFAVYIGNMHCGYVGSYLAGQMLVDEILAARQKVR